MSEFERNLNANDAELINRSQMIELI